MLGVVRLDTVSALLFWPRSSIINALTKDKTAKRDSRLARAFQQSSRYLFDILRQPRERTSNLMSTLPGEPADKAGLKHEALWGVFGMKNRVFV
jgi:hypothetical protein